MRIQHNIMAMNAYRNYNNNNKALSGNLEKLSSGYKINRAGDDAAGLAISEKMRAQITGLNAAQKNVKDGISLVKTAEGAMQEIHDMLNRMDYLATQSANGTYDNEVDRLNLQKEVDSLKTEINRIADSANFNGIKLLDGSLDINGQLSITTEIPTTEKHAGVDGITVGDTEQGGGTNGTFTISVDQLFGSNDALEITFGSGSGFVDTASATTDKPASEGADDTSALLALNGNTGKLTLTKGVDTDATHFVGNTKEEQAASIAEALKANDEVTAQFDVRAEGSKVILTNKNEGNDQATVTKAEAAAGNAKATVTVATDAATAADGTDSEFTFAGVIADDNTGMELNKGDVLTFKVTDANGNDWTAKVELNDKIMGADNATTQSNLVDALNGTLAGADKIYFEANDKTVAKEEKFEFKDLFGAANDSGDLVLTAKDKGGVFAGSTMTLSSTNDKVNDATATDASNDPGTALKATATITVDDNYSIGDKFKFNGTLSDGRTFEFELEAGKDFAVEDTKSNTVDNIVAALAKGTGTVTVKDPAGKIADEEVALSDIFSKDAGKKEIKVGNNNGVLELTSQVENAGAFAGKITGITYTAAETGKVGTDLRNGVQKTAASNSLSFTGTLKDGASVKVGNAEYQFVTDAAKADAGKTAIVVSADDLANGEKLAEALANQLTTDAGTTDPAYKVEQDGNKVTITTTAKGSDVAAPVIESGTPSHEDVVFELQPNKLKAGSTITVNGKTFEFIDKTKDKDAKAADGNIAIDVDMVKGDKEAINQAMVDALAKEGFEARLEDGKVKICNDGEEKIEVSFNNGKALTLQIGDTSDSFNQLAVSVGDMHTWAMKIDGIDISTQEGAQAAIDYVKDAINYVSGVRGDLGAIQNRLDHTANNLSVMAENIQDAESTIRDTDVAEEMMSYVKNNILVQSAQAMLAQANQVPQGVLQLLG